MLDCQVFGLKPWGHHLTNVLLHALNAGLVFVLLRQMTGAMWRSLLVAALFAVHPLRVESVAWVAERKDVLSGFFGLLSLNCYARYAQRKMQNAECRMQKPETRSQKSAAGGPGSVSVSPIFFLLSSLAVLSCPGLDEQADAGDVAVRAAAAGLLAAGSDVECRRQNVAPGETLNTPRSRLWRLVREKIPFFALAALASVVTFVVQKHGGAVVANVKICPWVRASGTP